MTRAGCLLCSAPTSTDANLNMVPAGRFAAASKPLIGRVQKVWQVSERLLSSSNCLVDGGELPTEFELRWRAG